MSCLEKFKWKILLVDGMLIETGGKFGENGMDDYIDTCVGIAEQFYRNTGEKKIILEIVDFYIRQYESETLWKYYVYEMKFLYQLKARIEQLMWDSGEKRKKEEKENGCKGNGKTR